MKTFQSTTKTMGDFDLALTRIKEAWECLKHKREQYAMALGVARKARGQLFTISHNHAGKLRGEYLGAVEEYDLALKQLRQAHRSMKGARVL